MRSSLLTRGSRENFRNLLLESVCPGLELTENFAHISGTSSYFKQQQTNDVFSDKWDRYSVSSEKERLYQFQRNWYLQLYGFPEENALREHLRRCNVVFDAGCGLGYKAAWFADLAPDTLIVGMDYSSSALEAAKIYRDKPNLFFLQGDIAQTSFLDSCVDFVSCDQVIMHTESPECTFRELSRITSKSGQLACYFYSKKALPRELLDDHFRSKCSELTRDELWEMSEQLTELGRRLSDLQISFDCPAIPALGINGGTTDLQRFIYWNFIKCFWNGELGRETSVVTNFDWYSPSNARRFSEQEVHELVAREDLIEIFFHREEACFSGRFGKSQNRKKFRTRRS